jgi:uncharacterized membrane protein YedE/YeeE
LWGKVDKDVLVGFGAVAATGLLLGLRFRFPALLAASYLLACAAGVIGVLSGWPFVTTFGRLAALLVTLQICFVLGLWLNGLIGRRRE